MARDDSKWTKEMSVLREGDSAWEQRTKTRAPLKDYSMEHLVEIEWDLNQDAIREKICLLRIDDDIEILLDAEEMQRLLRWV